MYPEMHSTKMLICQQVCILVGCVPTTAEAISEGGGRQSPRPDAPPPPPPPPTQADPPCQTTSLADTPWTSSG